MAELYTRVNTYERILWEILPGLEGPMHQAVEEALRGVFKQYEA
jgi:hypothetical protein